MQRSYFPEMENGELSRISQGLYTAMNSIVGPEEIIEVRRTITNFDDETYRILNKDRTSICSGSKADGFRFSSSDEDVMSVYNNIRVIPSDSYLPLYNSNMTLLVMQNEMTKPGFTLLRLVGETTEVCIQRSAVRFQYSSDARKIISSKRWRDFHSGSSPHSDILYSHGPCLSCVIDSDEHDLALCLKSDIWPSNAQNCIKRLYTSSWPSVETIESIINDGVLFVAIGAKQSFFENVEWRMSFSLAEKKLVHAMNHTQFLCYGLLKTFLRDAINRNIDIKGLLCSYYIKTVVLWEISLSPETCNWTPSSLLIRFWDCFRRLVHWVSCSYCPNFFVPENNMFEGKIESTSRAKLLDNLNVLYKEGFRCLLRCPSRGMATVMEHSDMMVVEPGEERVSTSRIAINIIYEYNNTFNYSALDQKHIIQLIFFLHRRLLRTEFSGLTRFLTSNLLQKLLVLVSTLGAYNYSASVHGRSNKLHYKDHRQRMNVLNRCQTDSVCHYLYKAILSYANKNYSQSVRLAQRAKDVTLTIDSVYTWAISEDDLRVAGVEYLPINTVLKNHCTEYVRIIGHQCIPKLYIECHDNVADPSSVITNVPPLVLANFLQYLCYTELENVRKREETLSELCLIVQHDNGLHIPKTLLPRSWNMLGICQQMSGDDQSACRSYLTALRLSCVCRKRSLCIRLGTILVKYFS